MMRTRGRTASSVGLVVWLFVVCALLQISSAKKKKKENEVDKFYRETREAGIAFMEENAKKEGVYTRKSGLQYKVLTNGQGKYHPLRGSPCEVIYEGRKIDGRAFDSSPKDGTTARFTTDKVIAGWQEAMRLMVEGDKWEIFIPPRLAYGNQGVSRKIWPDEVLVFTIEMVKIGGAGPMGKRPKFHVHGNEI